MLVPPGVTGRDELMVVVSIAGALGGQCDPSWLYTLLLTNTRTDSAWCCYCCSIIQKPPIVLTHTHIQQAKPVGWCQCGCLACSARRPNLKNMALSSHTLSYLSALPAGLALFFMFLALLSFIKRWYRSSFASRVFLTAAKPVMYAGFSNTKDPRFACGSVLPFAVV